MKPLSDLEFRCLCLLASGKTDHEIAAELDRSGAAVRICFENILAKSKAKTRPHSLVLALKAGFIKLDDLPWPIEVGFGSATEHPAPACPTSR